MKDFKNLTWEVFETYLLYDKKLSASKPALWALRSRFLSLQKFFETHDFTRQNFILFISQEKQRGISDSTINKYTSCIKHLASYLEVEGFTDLTYFREKKQDVDILSWEEMQALANVYMPYRLSKDGVSTAMQNKRMQLFYTLLTLTGCRQSEACNLKWDNLHDGYVKFEDTKNGEDRFVPIPHEFYEKLKTLPKTCNKIFNLSDVSGYALQDLKRRQKRLGIDKRVYLHIFRHSVATLLLKNNENPYMISKLLGWKDVNTINRYEHLNLSPVEEMLLRSSVPFGKNQTFEFVKKRLIEFVTKCIDNLGLMLRIEETNRSLKFEVYMK